MIFGNNSKHIWVNECLQLRTSLFTQTHLLLRRFFLRTLNNKIMNFAIASLPDLQSSL